MKHKYLRLTVALLLAAPLFFISCKKGDQGPAGTANVIYSDWLDVNFTPTTNTSGDTLSFNATIAAAKLTSDILANGEIKVYINFGTSASPDISPLPYFDGGYIINPEFKLNTISLIANDNFSTGTSGGNKYLQYRYVLIPGGVKATSSVNWNNYKEVQQATGMQN